MANNSKNPTILFFDRMAKAAKGMPGTLVSLMTNFFGANYGKTEVPKVAADFIIFDQLTATGVTTVNFFNGTATPQRTNFPGGSFTAPQGEHMIIQGIKLLDGANATVNATDWQPGIGDAATKNAWLDVIINGQKVLTQLPLTAFDTNKTSATTAGATNENRGIYFFTEPLVLLGQQQANVVITFPTASATANLNMRCELHGVRFIGN